MALDVHLRVRISTANTAAHPFYFVANLSMANRLHDLCLLFLRRNSVSYVRCRVFFGFIAFKNKSLLALPLVASSRIELMSCRPCWAKLHASRRTWGQFQIISKIKSIILILIYCVCDRHIFYLARLWTTRRFHLLKINRNRQRRLCRAYAPSKTLKPIEPFLSSFPLRSTISSSSSSLDAMFARDGHRVTCGEKDKWRENGIGRWRFCHLSNFV